MCWRNQRYCGIGNFRRLTEALTRHPLVQNLPRRRCFREGKRGRVGEKGTRTVLATTLDPPPAGAVGRGRGRWIAVPVSPPSAPARRRCRTVDPAPPSDVPLPTPLRFGDH